jgi:hypothetical protein
MLSRVRPIQTGHTSNTYIGWGSTIMTSRFRELFISKKLSVKEYILEANVGLNIFQDLEVGIAIFFKFLGAVVAHYGSSGGSLWEQWWLIMGAVVAHYGSSCGSLWEQWWLIMGAVVAHYGSSGGSLVTTPDCKTAGSNPAISPAYSGLLS